MDSLAQQAPPRFCGTHPLPGLGCCASGVSPEQTHCCFPKDCSGIPPKGPPHGFYGAVAVVALHISDCCASGVSPVPIQSCVSATHLCERSQLLLKIFADDPPNVVPHDVYDNDDAMVTFHASHGA